MVAWSRIRHLKFEGLSNQCKRWYSQFQIPGVSSTYYIAGKTTTKVFEKPNTFACRKPTDLYGAVRSFAAPVQAKPKPEPKDSSGPRLNNQITADLVRLVSDEGHAVVSRREALDRARRLNLDLVEVQRAAKVPVVKIMDYSREQFKRQQKEKETTKKIKSKLTLRNVCKEVRFKGKTELKDLQMKADAVKRLMEKGYRVKCMAMGKEDQDLGGLLSRLSAMIEDVSVVESGPRVESTKAYVILRHIKFGPIKSGGSKGSDKKPPPNFVEEDPDSSSETQSPPLIEENWETEESDSESEDDIIPDQAESPIASAMKRKDGKLGQSKMAWSSFDAGEDDFEKLFDVGGGGMDSAARTPYPQQDTQSVQGKSVPSPVVNPSFMGENRYNSKSETRTGVIPNRRPPGPMDSARVPVTRFSDQHKPPPRSTARPSPYVEQSQQVGHDGTGASSFRTFKQPPPPIDQTRVQGGHSHQGSPTIPPQTPIPTPSYGIFSVPKSTNPHRQNSSKEVTREVDSVKQKTESGQSPEANKTREGGFGIFSRGATSSVK